MEVLRALVSHFLGEIQYFLILKMLLRHVLMIMCEFSKGTLSSGAEQFKPFFQERSVGKIPVQFPEAALLIVYL